jgi:hypothetical protein
MRNVRRAEPKLAKLRYKGSGEPGDSKGDLPKIKAHVVYVAEDLRRMPHCTRALSRRRDGSHISCVKTACLRVND